MAHPTAVILVAGLSRSLIGASAPRLGAMVEGGCVRDVLPVFPAVTCSVQSTMLTGQLPGAFVGGEGVYPPSWMAGESAGLSAEGLCDPGGVGHGIVANGWYDRELAEVRFWKQSNRLVGGEKVWETARRRDASVTCANLFWWFNMYSSVDVSVTPRPIYKADGRKIPDVYTEPAGLRDKLQGELGQFPLFNFWGPASSIRSSEWIAEAALRVQKAYRPTLSLIYLPHLDYDLQRLGPEGAGIGAAVAEIDAVVGRLVDGLRGEGVRPLIVSEYAVEAVDTPVALNRVLRERGLLRVREEQGLELIDAGASEALAVCDHQAAHVYVKDSGKVAGVAELLRGTPGVAHVLDPSGQMELGMAHGRSGDLVLVAEAGHWFSYPYWLDDARAPDFARTVDIHRKPGYDPLELFIDPSIAHPKLRLARKLIQKKLGFRTLFDVIPLDGALVKGSHGRVNTEPGQMPVLISDRSLLEGDGALGCWRVRDVILDHLFGD